jgi:hypothetical protein
MTIFVLTIDSYIIGYGFVRFSDETEQQRALQEMQGVMCGSRPMRISMATSKHRPNGLYTVATPPIPLPSAPATAIAPPTAITPVAPLIYGMNAPPYTVTTPMASLIPTPATQTTEYNQFTDPNNTTIFVGGLTGYTTEDDLRQAFSTIGEVTYVRIPPGRNCGFVQFRHRACAEQALAQMNGCTIGTSRVRLSWGRPQHIPPPSATTSFSRMAPTFTPTPIAIPNMQTIPGIQAYPGYYTQPVMTQVIHSMFPTPR